MEVEFRGIAVGVSALAQKVTNARGCLCGRSVDEDVFCDVAHGRAMPNRGRIDDKCFEFQPALA
jgi:hypothetical protein